MQQPVTAQPPALPPGTLVGGRYLIQGYIGGGGFGHIYKAHDSVLGHRRALKEAFYRDIQTQRQFRLEAEFILNARHPHLVRGYAVFEQNGRFYLVMDYVDGYTVEEIAIQHIRRTGKPLPEAQVLDWVLPICDACHALHTQPMPIIHRDVKPANIKITREGIPVLIDLGLAKLYLRGNATIGAALAFTPGYAPPEQYQASGATDQRTDVYGLGATLYYLLTGYQPTESPARLGPQALPTPRSLNGLISQATEDAVLRAMALDPSERQQTAHELHLELLAARTALSERDPVTLPPGTEGDATVLPAAIQPPTPPASASPSDAPKDPAPAAHPGPLPLATPSKLRAAGHRGGVMGADQTEALAVISAILSLVCMSLSFAALLVGGMLIFALPAVALGGWSLSRLRADALAGFRTIALIAYMLGATWPPIWMAVILPQPLRWMAVLPLLIGTVWPIWLSVPLLRQLLGQVNGR